ncbi:MAG: DNA repair protein RadA [Candidatus Gracilibacteria bacterium]|nr:DNA repair protein RadA [Candidatus Peregrinibacteria bacterium]
MKLKTIYICESCGHTAPKWLGKCPDCDAWNSFHEDVVAKDPKREHKGVAQSVQPLHQVKESDNRIPTNIGELDRVLGGGIIEGSLVLMSGEPGIGKSTLTLKLCEQIANVKQNVLYVSGEESVQQISLRAKRMGIQKENLGILGENSVENIMETLEAEKPDFVVIDSIQVMNTGASPSLAGSMSQIRACTEIFMTFAKQNNVPILIIGHVNKEGNLAGPKVLEHLVDTVLLIEGDRYQNLRVLRTVKNRYGSTNEIGLFEMTDTGLAEVRSASKLFLEGRKADAFGSAITAVVEGTRPLLLEVQALTSSTPFGYPKRAASGYDVNRLQLLLAVIQKHLRIDMSSHDVYVNVVGGFKVNDRSTDLAVIMAIISSLYKTALPQESLFIGEVGLSGELRSVPHLKKRIQEASKIGFSKIYTPPTKEKVTGLTPVAIEEIGQALKELSLKKSKTAKKSQTTSAHSPS